MNNWYYIHNQKSIGPLNEERLRELAEKGIIQPQSMVWNPHMHYGYVKYESLRPDDFTQKTDFNSRKSEIKPNENEGRCIECHKIFLRAEMLPYSRFFVCSTCKPVFIQKLKEGAYKEEAIFVAEEMRYAGFWIRLLAKLIDSLILYLINLPVTLLTPLFFKPLNNNATYFWLIQGNLSLFGIIMNAVYNTLFVGKWSATPGKMIFNLRMVTADRKRIGYLRALGRYFAEYISSLICGIGYFMAAFDEQKRTLHDQICRTRVVYKQE